MTVEFVKNKCVYCFYICVKICYMYGEYKLFIDRLPLFNKNYIFLKGLFCFSYRYSEFAGDEFSGNTVGRLSDLFGSALSD